MAAETLAALLEGNRAHVESLPDGYFDDVLEAQHPAVVSICCSDSRVPQQGMWAVDEPGWLFTPSNIGNQAWDVVDGERVVDGNLLYPVANTGTETIAVVGHTGCGAVTAAYQTATGDSGDHSPGIAAYVDRLLPVVEDALERGIVDEEDESTAVNRLVEYNVDRQVAFLRDAAEIADGIDVYGFVYDFQGVYGDVAGRTYLVNADGETGPGTLREHVPAGYEEWVRRLRA